MKLRELWQFRYLVGLYVYRDFVVHYKQTILGPLWWLFQPLFATGMFTVVFSMIAKLPTDSLPPSLFYLSGLIVWNFFSQSLLHTAQTFLDHKEVFKKVYFPRLVVPVAAVLSNLMRFVLQFSLFVLFYLIFLGRGVALTPHWTILLLPLLLLYVAMLAFGMGITVAAVTTKYRDLALVLPFFVQFGMFVSVVIYPLSQVPPAWQFWFSLNPMVPPIELFRFMFFGVGGVDTAALLIGIALTLVIFLVGMFAFNRAESTFADTI